MRCVENFYAPSNRIFSALHVILAPKRVFIFSTLKLVGMFFVFTRMTLTTTFLLYASCNYVMGLGIGQG